MEPEANDDQTRLLDEQEASEAEDHSINEGKVPVKSHVAWKGDLPGNRRRHHPADLPFSVEDHSSSASIRVPSDGNSVRHRPERPQRKKPFTVARWTLGVLMLLCLVALAVAGVYLVYASTSRKAPWWTSGIIYQCYPQSFQDTDGDGVGDLKGIRSRTAHFEEIGVQAVWLNPIFDSPQRDNGYDISNYTAIHAKYGTMKDFKELLDDLHARDLHLLLDFVPNHTSDQHPWFKTSRENKTNPKRNWYIWANGTDGNKSPPNNWISVFGGSAWTYDNHTSQWYLHQFSEFQPDLNYTNKEVQDAMIDVLRFWLDMGVDGFRVDAVKFLLEDPKLRNETRSPSFNESQLCAKNVSNPACYDSLVHNLTTDYVGIHNITREWRSIIDEYSEKTLSPKVLIGEIYDDVEKVMSYYGHNGDEFSFPFNFFLLNNAEWTGSAVACIAAQWLNNMPYGGTANWVLGNHDNPRIASKAGVFLARALNILLLTLPGAATTYYGEEIMMTDVDVPPDKQQDKYAHRDPERTPMQWNTSAHAGFTFPKATPWLPLANNYTMVNVDVERNSSMSMLQLYKMLSDLRNKNEVFLEGNYTCINATDELLVFIRHAAEGQSSDRVFVVAINFSPRNLTTRVDLSLSETEIVLSSFLDMSADENLKKVDLNSSLALRSGEGLVVMGAAKTKESHTKIKDYGSKSKCNFCRT